MKKRLKKLPLIISGLSAIALGSVGFSAWVITGTTGNGTVDGAFTIGTAPVEDRRMEISIADHKDGVDKTVKFDCESSDSTGPIKFGGEGNGEDLSFGFKVKVKGALVNSTTNFNEWFSGLSFNLTVTDTADTDYANAISNNYIVAPLTDGVEKTILKNDITVDQGTVAKTSSDGTYTYTAKNFSSGTLELDIKFNYKWGSAFAGLNPGKINDEGKYVNEGIIGSLSGIDNAKIALTNLYKVNSSVKFKIVVGVK